MKNSLLGLLLVSSALVYAQAGKDVGKTAAKEQVKGAMLMAKDLPGIPGKEGLMLTVELAPGAASPPHRHNASTFVYVLEGKIVMQVKGGPEVTLGPGETFYELPTDIHTVGKNASATQSAKFLVFMVKEKGAPVSMPEHQHDR
jgi:quercetin dioxygenase-like cupin family protein